MMHNSPLINGKIGAIHYQCPRAAGNGRGRGTATLEVEMHPQSTLRRGSVPRLCERCGAPCVRKFCSSACSNKAHGDARVLPAWDRVRANVVFAEQVPAYAPQLGPCWLWTGDRDPRGYGRVWVDDHKEWAHRFIYVRLIGPIDQDLQIDHLCRVRGCVNPFHLEPVTRRVNLLRGIGFSARNAVKTECLRGHPFNAENTRIVPKGRKCRVCQRERDAIRYLKLKVLMAERRKAAMG